MKPKFLTAVDAEAKELYILHRDFPACLIQVIQTTPVTFKIVDLYDNIDESELKEHPFLEDAKRYFREKMAGTIDRN